MIMLEALLIIAIIYGTLGLAVAVCTAHRLATGWMYVFAFAFVIVVWPALVFDLYTNKADF